MTDSLRPFCYIFVPVVLGIHALLIIHGAWIHSTIPDEPGHIASGVLNWQTGNYEPYRVNPPLYRQLATLPLLLAEPKRLSNGFATALPFHRSESEAGVVFAEQNADRYRSLVFYSRLMGAVWSCLGAWVVMRWARSLYGTSAGYLALCLWCFEPNLVAHAQLVTPDLPASVAALLAMYVLRSYLLYPSWEQAIFVGAALAIALLTKFTLLVLVPVVLVVVLFLSNSIAWRYRFLHSWIILVTALFFIHMDYEFTKSLVPLRKLEFVSTSFAGERPRNDQGEMQEIPGNRFRGTILEHFPVPVPADYLLGIDVQRLDFEQGWFTWYSFLNGEWKIGGWPHYYLFAMFIKIPLGFLILISIGILLFLIRHRLSAPWKQELLIYLPALAILLLVSSQMGFNHHMRYVLPCFPFLILGAAKIASNQQPLGWIRFGLMVSCLFWGISSSLWYYPHSLSYFNELVGGPSNGYKYLVDSNIDWGQDLILLKQWQELHPEAYPMAYALFNSLDLSFWGLEGSSAPLGCKDYPDLERCGPQPGWYAVCVNGLQGRRLMNRFPPFSLTYFQHFVPVDRVGYSIFIYHLKLPEVHRVRQQLGLPEIGR